MGRQALLQQVPCGLPLVVHMKNLKKLKIYGQTVKVTQKPLAEIDSDCNGGWARWEHNELIIANDVPQDRKELLLLHETLHFVNVYLTEEQVTYLSESLYQIVKDNPKFWEAFSH